MEGNIAGYQVRNRAVSPDLLMFRLKEDVRFNKRDGKTYGRSWHWPCNQLHYLMAHHGKTARACRISDLLPDLREALVRNKITNPLNINGYVTREEVFENRLFESNILKSSRLMLKTALAIHR